MRKCLSHSVTIYFNLINTELHYFEGKRSCFTISSTQSIYQGWLWWLWRWRERKEAHPHTACYRLSFEAVLNNYLVAMLLFLECFYAWMVLEQIDSLRGALFRDLWGWWRCVVLTFISSYDLHWDFLWLLAYGRCTSVLRSWISAAPLTTKFEFL